MGRRVSTFWRGELRMIDRGVGLVAGKYRRVVRLDLDRMHYLDDSDGSAWMLVTVGRGDADRFPARFVALDKSDRAFVKDAA